MHSMRMQVPMPQEIRDTAFEVMRENIPRSSLSQVAQTLWTLSRGPGKECLEDRNVIFGQGHAQILRCMSRFPESSKSSALLFCCGRDLQSVAV
jgi:hypothetical protein